MKLGIVVLAAGQGTRMKSELPKVLHRLAGKALLQHVLETANQLNPDRVVVVHGHGGDMVQQAFTGQDVIWVEQERQLGTGHAVLQALPSLVGMDQILVLYGDVPLIKLETLVGLIEQTTSDLGLLTVVLDDPSGYGRIIRDEAGNVLRIVEQKDATPGELETTEINTGIMLLGREKLAQWLANLSSDNSQGEYYLTDVIAMAVADGVAIHIAHPQHPVEAEGVNDRAQLADLERYLQAKRARALMDEGVSLADPARFDLRGELTVGRDVWLDVNVIIEGKVSLGDEVSVGANTVLRNVRIADGVTIKENCVVEDAVIEQSCHIGPFSRIRPGTELATGVHVGNFVEIKNAHIAAGSKINHLSYIGDTDMGTNVNIGAGTITCNYDGANKHRTTIGDDAFIGSNTALVAPVSVGEGATIGAGSTINKNAAANKLSLTRAKQLTLDGWQRPKKK